MTISAFNLATVKKLRAEFLATVADLGNRHGVVFDLGRITFSGTEARGKITMTVMNPGTVETDAPAPAKKGTPFPAAGVGGITNADIGKTFTHGRHTFRIDGYNPNRPTRCIRITRMHDDKSMICSPEMVAVGLGLDAGTRNDPDTYPGDWDWKDGEATDTYLKRTDAMFAAIPRDKMIGFPIADGRALYYVVSLRPLRLQHIPYGDAYRISPAHLRGLRANEVERMIASETAMAKLFGQRAAQHTNS